MSRVFTLAELEKANDLPLMGGELRRIEQLAPGWVTNGHWIARCNEKAAPLSPERKPGARRVLSLAKADGVPLRRSPAHWDEAKQYDSQHGVSHYVTKSYARLLRGLKVLAVPCDGQRHLAGLDAIAGVDRDGHVAIVISPRTGP